MKYLFSEKNMLHSRENLSSRNTCEPELCKKIKSKLRGALRDSGASFSSCSGVSTIEIKKNSNEARNEICYYDIELLVHDFIKFCFYSTVQASNRDKGKTSKKPLEYTE